MEERCGKLYEAIKVAYEDMSVRQNVELSRILLSASNEIIKSNDAGLSAMYLEHELNLFYAHNDFQLPRGVLNLKDLTHKWAADYYEKKEVSKWIKLLWGYLGGE